jgi:hypothetical protein
MATDTSDSSQVVLHSESGRRPKFAPRRARLQAILTTAALFGVVSFAASGAALAAKQGREGGAVRLLKTIPIPGEALRGFDISWVDASTERYYLSDRSNKAIDVIDAKIGTFLKQINIGGFVGVVFDGDGAGDNSRSGPNGVVASGRWLFAGDGGSRLVSIDLTNDTVADTLLTAGNDPFRANELAYDPEGGIILITNSGDSPPFVTLISVNQSNGRLTKLARITLDAAHGVDATNGLEAVAWNPGTGRFYVSIPELSGPGGTGPNGAVARIDPHTATVDALFPVEFCQPGGLAVGPHRDLLVGCTVVFDTAGDAWSATDANTAAPRSVIMDARNGRIERVVRGVSGSDEVWFNPGDGQYYLSATDQPGGPVLGVIDAASQTLAQVVPTLNVEGKAFVFPEGSAHSVAANPHNNHVFMPLPANNVFPHCLNGCIAVYGR